MKFLQLAWLALLTTALRSHAVDFQPLTEFGDNPGELSASVYLPDDSKNLLVLLHGCGQDAQQFARQTGISQLAHSTKTAILLPQQNRSNNAASCFNWFSAIDQQKGQGEVLSIINMVDKISSRANITATYLVGFSAGGAMASNLATQYPELFNSVAVVAGIPFPCANNLVKAISCMKSGASVSSQTLAKSVIENASRWPNLTVVTGSADTVVNPVNSKQMAQQWAVLTSSSHPPSKLSINDWQISRWLNHKVELIEIEKLAHGFPVSPKQKFGGEEAPYLVSSSQSLAVYLFNKWITD